MDLVKAAGSHIKVTLQRILGSRVQGNLKVEVIVEGSRSTTSVPGGNQSAF
jgi:hypothetical protein